VSREATLHQRIRSDISERILSGAWPPGHRVPSEHVLMAEYGCSRMTVSKALTPLAESGLIVRRRRAGSFVARPKIHSVVLDIPDIAAEVGARGEAYGYTLIEAVRRPARDGDRAALDLDRAVQVLSLRCLHTAGGRPFAYEERLINLDAAPDAAGVDFAAVPPGSWLLSHVPWTEAEHRISASNANAGVSRALGVHPGTACLILERRTWRGDDKITFVRLSFPGDAYDLVARFTPAGPAR
jgi:GntR family histidine utilization transcriptional repressor